MKYMTKEWYEATQTECLFPPNLKIDQRAEVCSDVYFRKLYAQEKAEWLTIRAELMEDWGEPFDPKAEAKWFARNFLMRKHKLLAKLPHDFLREVADIRVLALGYCTERVHGLCGQFLKEKREEYTRTTDAYYAYAETEWREVPFWQELYFHDAEVKSLRKNGNSLIMQFDPEAEHLCHHRIMFTDAVVVKQDRRLKGTEWLYHEIYKTQNGYEIHVLLWHKKQLVDFIVQCSDVIVQ